MILRYMSTASLRMTFSIILLFPFALQAMDDASSNTSIPADTQKQANAMIFIGAYLSAKHGRDSQRLYFPTQDGKLINPLLPSTKTLTIPGATAIVTVTAINENAANIKCQCHYMHTIMRLKPVEESVTREVTVNMDQEVTNVNFGDSAYSRREPSQAIPAESSYCATLTLRMSKSNQSH